jgi:hypothetical protein
MNQTKIKHSATAYAIGRADSYRNAAAYFKQIGKPEDAKLFRDMMRTWGLSVRFHINLDRGILK